MARFVVVISTCGVCRHFSHFARPQVRVRVLFCGMCHSDCHKIDDDWHDHVKYPMVR